MGEVRTRDARHRSLRRRRSTSWSFRARRRPASGAFSFGRGLDFPPSLIRSEASLYEAQAEGLHALIRRSPGNSQPLCLIREARRPGTEGAGPILATACCSHSPARRPAHLGGFSGSVWISFPCLIHETLNRASQRALAPPASRLFEAWSELFADDLLKRAFVPVFRVGASHQHLPGVHAKLGSPPGISENHQGVRESGRPASV